MFSLNETEATIRYTPRVELHGEDTEPGCTLNISVRGNNTLLDLLDDRLRKMFYMEPPKEEQDMVDQVAEEGDNLVKLRFPMLKRKQDWSYETSGYRVVIGGGLNDDSELIFVQCDLTKFSFEIEEGGSITLKFNITCKPTVAEAGKLYQINGSKVELTLEPPSPEQRAQMDLDDAA